MNEKLIDDGRCRVVTADVAVLGSGTAALNAAVRLKRLGVDDVIIVTEALGVGTSANAGSDKQTYYRLNPAYHHDSALAMAEDLFNGGCMHGDIALVEAALSQQQFFHLADLGVPFPHDRWGDYTGYITDHDAAGRGTSAGPGTSIMMYEALLREVRLLGIPVLDSLQAVELFILPEKAGRRCAGFAALPAGGEGVPECTVVTAGSVFLGIGGPGDLFRDSVYPENQGCALGMVLAAGTVFQNLAEGQFGIASTSPRWNLSGSYQQVLPRYYSVEPDGSGEEDFLADFFPDPDSMLSAQFLKGYQWPFDARKVSGYGSSVIDLLVYYERNLRRRRVFLDFRSNPRFPGYSWNIGNLPANARDYLRQSSALLDTPVERLKAMNEDACRLYLDRGVDLAVEPLEIAVSRQHMNGGILPNIWWESTIPGLFAAGECAGSHGIYRPGGSALNAGQVGSSRAAEKIAARYRTGTNPPVDPEQAEAFARRFLGYLDGIQRQSPKVEPEAMMGTVRERMSRHCAVFRDPEALAGQLEDNLRDLENLGDAGTERPASWFHLRDLLLTERAVATASLHLLKRLSGSRGSFIRGREAGFFRTDETGVCTGFSAIEVDGSDNGFVQETVMNNDRDITVRYRPVRSIPRQPGWFEEVWRDFQSGRVFDE